jgi:hypothetical protein
MAAVNRQGRHLDHRWTASEASGARGRTWSDRRWIESEASGARGRTWSAAKPEEGATEWEA